MNNEDDKRAADRINENDFSHIIKRQFYPQKEGNPTCSLCGKNFERSISLFGNSSGVAVEYFDADLGMIKLCKECIYFSISGYIRMILKGELPQEPR